MNKSILIIGLIITIGAFLVGCAQTEPIDTTNQLTDNMAKVNTTNNADTTSNLKETESNDKIVLSSIDDILNQLKNSFQLGEKEETYYQMIGAYDGTKIDVDGTKIEIYQFKESQNEALVSAQDSMDNADNQIFIVNNEFLILVHSTDSDLSNNIQNVFN